MSNIFNASDNQNILARLERITSDTIPLWGKMNAAQMVLHCQKPIDVALGVLTLKPGIFSFLFGKWAKNKFLREMKFSENAPTAPQFKIRDTPDFDTEKAKLLALIRQFGETGPAIIANKTHPFFGTMTDDEWGTLHYVHLDHHLTQFGV